MTVINGSPFDASILRYYGLDSGKMSTQTQDIPAPNSPLGTGTYDVEAKNHQSDTIEFGNQHDIFAQVETDGKDDKVKLDGTGWVQIPSSNSNVPGGQILFINKNTNSAVAVNGGGTVTDDQGNTIPTQLQPARATARRLLEPKTNPADAALVLTTDGNYEKVAGGPSPDHKISLSKAQAACKDPNNSQGLRDALYWLTTGGHFEQVAGGPNKDISLQQLQDFYNQNKPQ